MKWQEERSRRTTGGRTEGKQKTNNHKKAEPTDNLRAD